MTSRRTIWVSAGLYLVLGSSLALGTPIVDQVDDFSSGLMGWQEGGPSPNPPQISLTEGPGGDGDAFLENRSTGGFGPGGKQAMFNRQPRWRGDYMSAGITAIDIDLNNLGNTALIMRLHLEGSGGDVFTPGFDLAPGSGWQTRSFSLAIDDLLAASNVSIMQTLANVTQLWMIHNDDASDRQGIPAVNALLGVDNVRAVGLPSELLAGDFNDSGVVEQADLDLVLLHWGDPIPPIPESWSNDLPEGTIDQQELDKVLLHWGDSRLALAANVPEPTTWCLLFVGLTGLVLKVDICRLRSG